MYFTSRYNEYVTRRETRILQVNITSTLQVRRRSRACSAEFAGWDRRERRKSTAAENSRRRLRTLNPLVLAVSLKARSTAENARWRQRTLYPLVLSKARRVWDGLSGRLPKTLGGDRERSTPLFRRRLGEE